MPTIRFSKNYPQIEVAPGARMMDELLLAGMPVASSCHGDGVCGKCRVRIVTGANQLTPIEPLEELIHARLKVEKGYRISCQTKINGDIEIDTAYW